MTTSILKFDGQLPVSTFPYKFTVEKSGIAVVVLSAFGDCDKIDGVPLFVEDLEYLLQKLTEKEAMIE